jgi:DNA-binding response OmpR family regulator
MMNVDLPPENQPTFSARGTGAEGARVLVVEDDPDFSELLELVLRTRGYEVILASNVEEGQAKIREQLVDCVITDVMLPNGVGLQFMFLDEIRAHQIPMIVMTAFGSRALRRYVEGVGIPLLEKPFAMDALVARVLMMVVHHRCFSTPPEAPTSSEHIEVIRERVA